MNLVLFGLCCAIGIGSFVFMLLIDWGDSPLILIPIVLISICIVIGSCILSFEFAARCSNCNSIIHSERYCGYCGYELIPHCDACGKGCETAFCSLCGAEQ